MNQWYSRIMTKFHRMWFFAALISMSVIGRAEVKPPEYLYTLDNLLHEAYLKNTSYLTTIEALEESKISRSIAKRNYLPTLSLSGNYTETDSDESYGGGLTLNQPLFQGGRLSAERKIAKIQYDIAQLSVVREKQTLKLSIIQSWYDLLVAQESVYIAQDALKRLRRSISIAKEFYKEGQNWRSDVLQAELAYAQGEQDLIRAKNSVYLAKASLNDIIGRNIEAPMIVRSKLHVLENPWQWTLARETALEQHPDLKTAKLNAMVSRHNITVSSSSLYPQLSLVGQKNESHSVTNDTDTDSHSVALNLNMTLWAWGTNYQRRKVSKSQYNQQKINVGRSQQSIELSVKQSLLNVDEAQLRLRILEQSKRQAEENYRVNELRYKEQLSSANDLLDAQSLLSSNLQSYATALGDYLKALATLEFEVGCTQCEIRFR